MPSAAQQKQQQEMQQPGARPQKRKRQQKPAAVLGRADDSDLDSLLGELGEDDWDYDPDEDSSADEEFADDMLAGLHDLDDSLDESDQEEAPHSAHRKGSQASAR
jgi:hypothetical protein